MTHRITTRAALALALATAATAASANDLYWQGGTADLTGANYYDATAGTPGVSPNSSDLLYIGDGGTANATTAGSISVGRLLVGTSATGGGTSGPAGDGTVYIGPGVSVSTTGGKSGAVNAGVLVGAGANGTLNIDGGSLTVNTLLTVGYGNDAGIAGSVNVSNGGSLTVSGNNLNLGDAPVFFTGGEAGNVSLTGGSITVSNGNAIFGIQNGSSYTQSDGTLSVSGTTYVGRRNADGSSFTLSGGSITTGNFTTADGAASDGYTDDVTATISGGSLSVTGALNVANGAARNAQFSITGGAVTSGAFNVGVGNNTPDGTTVAISGGSLTCSSFNVGSATSATSDPTNTHITLSGSANVSITGGLNLTQKAADNTTMTITDDAVVSMAANLSVGGGAATNTTLNIGGNAHVTVGTPGAASNVLIGRGTSDHTTFNMTGGALDVAQHFLMGTSTSATHIVGNQSAGTLTTGVNFVVADTGTGDSTYNLSGTGAVVAGGRGIVGRQHGTGVFNQTGGSATFNNSLRIGDSQDTDPSLDATGTYNISAGALNASVPDPTALDSLAIAPAGNGTLHITGDGATITVTGNMNVYAHTNGDTNVGTLAYTLEPGESLTEINVTGTATFAAGSILSLDSDGTTPTQPSYDLLTAADIIDNGLTFSFSAPGVWHFQIIPGGNGKILEAFRDSIDFPGDTNNDGVVDLTDLNNVLNNFGVTASGNPGDTNSDGTVDLTDLNNVLNHFGETHAASALSTVPEPASLALLAIGASAFLARRRRSR